MRLHVAAIGRLKPGPEQALAAEYLDRAAKLGRRAGFSSIAVHELAESRAASAPLRTSDEARRLLAALPAATFLIALDPEGKALSSTGLAGELARRRDSGVADLAFLIGGPDGHGAAIAAEAKVTLSFGPMTWPHRLVRVMLAEQIYRSVTILTNHPYHRA